MSFSDSQIDKVMIARKSHLNLGEMAYSSSLFTDKYRSKIFNVHGQLSKFLNRLRADYFLTSVENTYNTTDGYGSRLSVDFCKPDTDKFFNHFTSDRLHKIFYPLFQAVALRNRNINHMLQILDGFIRSSNPDNLLGTNVYTKAINRSISFLEACECPHIDIKERVRFSKAILAMRQGNHLKAFVNLRPEFDTLDVANLREFMIAQKLMLINEDLFKSTDRWARYFLMAAYSQQTKQEQVFKLALLGLKHPDGAVQVGEVRGIFEIAGADKLIFFADIIAIARRCIPKLSSSQVIERQILGAISENTEFNNLALRTLWDLEVFRSEIQDDYPDGVSFRVFENYLLKPTKLELGVDVFSLEQDRCEDSATFQLNTYPQ